MIWAWILLPALFGMALARWLFRRRRGGRRVLVIYVLPGRRRV